MKEFAKNLYKLRKERGMSRSELAAKSGVPAGSLKNYEQDRYNHAVSLVNLMALADSFDVTPYYLLYGKEVEMATYSNYMKEVISELKQLSPEAIEEIHNSKASGVVLPKFSLTAAEINEITKKWNENMPRYRRGYYRNYVEQVMTRYVQKRQMWKKKYSLG